MRKFLLSLIICLFLVSAHQAGDSLCLLGAGGGGSFPYITNGLVLYYKLDEASGTTVTDSSTTGANGTYHGTTSSSDVPSTIQFPDPLSRSFNGTSDYIDAGSSTAIQPTTAGSVSFWIKLPSTLAANGVIVGDGDITTDSNGYFVFVLSASNSLRAEFATGSAHQTSTTVAFTSNTWTNFIITWDSTNIKTYRNGTLQATDPQTVVPINGVYNTNIGKNPATSSKFYGGLLDDVRIYNRALTSTEASTIASGAG